MGEVPHVVDGDLLQGPGDVMGVARVGLRRLHWVELTLDGEHRDTHGLRQCRYLRAREH